MIGALARHGVALKIFLGLFLLSLLLFAATAIAIYSFQRTSNTFRGSAEAQIGSLHFAAQLRQHTQAIAALAPGLIARDFDQGAVLAFSVEIFKEQGALLDLIDRLSGLLPGDQSLESLKDTAGKLVENTDAMSTAIYDRVVLKDQLNARIAELAALHEAVAEFYLDGETLDQASLFRLQQALDAINALALRALTLKTTDEVSMLASQAALHLRETTIVAVELSRLRSEILPIADGIADFANASDGFFEQRSQLLRADFAVSDLLAKSDRIAAKLSGEVDAVIAKIDAAVAGENEQLAATLSDRTRFLIILGGFGLLAAIGIAAFTQVSVIGRLNRLRRAMSGGLSDDQRAQDTDFGKDRNVAVIGLTKGGDEIAEMARAVTGYVEKLRQSDAEAKRSQQRLEAAIESMPGGFSLYDADDKLVVCNTRYRELFFPGDRAGPLQGQSFESVLSAVLARGLLVLPEGTESAWLMDRLKSHRAPQGQVSLLQRRDGRWVEINERRAENGDVVSIYSDVTQRQAFEAQLIEARTRAEAAREVADKRSSDLARLSEKLSKYLSPQIYSSIFAAGHDVVVAPQRKKLTVFFSDIADFAETTDNLESEDLTELLNDYLTEMSRIALEHGATIDKYIGDAIMIFFGDPDTRGVEEDARACVKMAIAMQRRMLELGEHWKSRGVQRPFRMRIAINTGFCTVGNFGSADRMDYTIIGSEVNLAARLQSHAELGGILLSHSTKALVGELVSTAELEPVTVKGFAEPVRVYRVLGILDTLENDGKTIQVELDGAQIKVDMARLSADDRRRLHDVAQVLVERLTQGT